MHSAGLDLRVKAQPLVGWLVHQGTRRIKAQCGDWA